MGGLPALCAIILCAGLSGCATGGTPVEAGATAGDRVIAIDEFDHALMTSELCAATNRARAAHGVPPLVHVRKLDEVADIQASYSALTLQAEHYNPASGENQVMDRALHAGLHPSLAAENAAMVEVRRTDTDGARGLNRTYSAMAALLIKDWMESPSHRLNILNPRYTQIGCAAELSHGVRGDPRLFAIQVFLLPDLE